MPLTTEPTVQERGVTPGQVRVRVRDYNKQQRREAAKAAEAKAKADRQVAAAEEKRQAEERYEQRRLDRLKREEDRKTVKLAKIESSGAPQKTLNSVLTGIQNVERQTLGTQETVGAIGTFAESAQKGAAQTAKAASWLPWVIGGGVLLWFVWKRKGKLL